MTTSQTANSALLRSLQRTRDRQTRVSVVPSSRASSRPQTRALDNTTTIETITTDPNGEQRIERRIINNNEQPNPKPLWNSSNVPQHLKPPRSVFLDSQPADNVVQRQIINATPTTRSIPNSEVTSPVKVVRMPSTVTQEPSNTNPVYIQNSQYPYQTNTRFIRTDPEVIVLGSQPAKRSIFNCFRRKKNYQTRYYGDKEILLNQPVRFADNDEFIV